MSHYFIGIQVKPELAKQLSEWQINLKKQLPYKRWTSRPDFHITLVFLGDMDGNLTYALQSKLPFAEAYSVFDIKRSELGTFGNQQQPRVLWMGIENNPVLNQLQRKVVQICESIGYNREKRAYTPHITIAKKWADQDKFLTKRIWNDVLENMPDLDNKFKVDAFHLYKVHPASNPKYEIVQSFPLTESNE
ncbi:RNA 2',3'-cyclic phosphodiesterase [Oceanobacillus neutriphilus]|uniref:RNA 2',3'-cyclic phosphodiesterase n=1 Tax=Oceanobacillus neutriphilus TaxID=531815 RepID=A0ABQ2NZN8_9BACI|nr:RNA 2',3'-cyclic phosphodiesterase [Oceanobacillus neutriphilus]GGP14275.1 RNA 2',3'-cyclic phosphodiesterase [Oceanobacillus neutriphilus]